MSNEHKIIAWALKDAPLNISMTRRQNSNGLRNADEIATHILAALAAAKESPCGDIRNDSWEHTGVREPTQLFDNPE